METESLISAQTGNRTIEITRLTIVTKGENFLTRICKSNRVSIR